MSMFAVVLAVALLIAAAISAARGVRRKSFWLSAWDFLIASAGFVLAFELLTGGASL